MKLGEGEMGTESKEASSRLLWLHFVVHVCLLAGGEEGI